MTYQYWHPKLEQLPRPELEAWQLDRLKNIAACAQRTPFYKERFAKAGIKGAEDFKTLADLKRIHFTTKHDLRDAFPYGFLSIPKD